MSALPHMQRLLEIMAQLRNPQGGCPWDLEQNFATIVPYTIEEAYEVADAIAREDRNDLREELGDLLLQVVFHAQMAKEEGSFSFEDVAAAISEKMLRRHPHVFGDAVVKDAAAQTENWEAIKSAERKNKAKDASVQRMCHRLSPPFFARRNCNRALPGLGSIGRMFPASSKKSAKN